MTRALIQAESILTQLIFDHALRLRMKDATKEEEKTSEDIPTQPARIEINIQEPVEDAPLNPDGLRRGDNVETEAETSESLDTTEVASSEGSQGSRKGKSVAKDRQAQTDKEMNESKGQGIAGKINVLMAADIAAVGEGEHAVSHWAPQRLADIA